MARRKLTQAEIDLWHKVVAKAERLHPEKGPAHGPLPKPIKKPSARSPQLQPKDLKTTVSIPPVIHTKPRMDQKQFGRMKRGKLVPEARIDLHGMTLDQAHPALIRFILRSQSEGKRLVLVITGKGKSPDTFDPTPQHRGILRRQVPHWLEIPPLTQAVLQVTPAHIRHGGEGALYVYLRKGR